MSVANILRNTAKEHPKKIAVYFEEQEITYEQLDHEVDNLAQGLLNLGLKRGQMVGLLLGNTPDFIRFYFAATRAGGVVIPINPLFKGEELKYILNDSNPVILVTTLPFINLVQSVWNQIASIKKVIVIGSEVSSDRIVSYKDIINKKSKPVELDIKDKDIASCLYTSGTTGRPKGALLSHGNLAFDCIASVKRIKFNFEDNHLCILPVFHSFCQMGAILAPIYTGGSITVVAQFHPGIILKEIKKRNISVFCGVPAMFNALLTVLANTNDYDLSSLRLCVSGGAPMPVEIIQAYEQKHNIIILEGNGPTETSPVSYVNPPELRKVGSVGLPLEGVSVNIVDENDLKMPVGEVGEICILGDNVMQSYLNLPEATAEALKGGWLHTGDLGKVDKDGYVFIVDRKKDMLIVGGLNVYPREVEECLYTHPKVADAAIIGIHDAKRGEVPLAVIALKAELTSSASEIISHCREHLANYKCPRKVVFMEKLPLNSTGKIDKKQLREAYSMGMIQ